MPKAISEIVGLSSDNCFRIVDRHKTEANYPLHKHKEYELNFVQNGAGIRRIVGDSVEVIGNFDLVLITSEELEHVWEQGDCISQDIREITIHFSSDLFSHSLLEKNQFTSIKLLFERASKGLSFPMEAIMKAYSILDSIGSERNHFLQLISCLELINVLSGFEGTQLASNSFAKPQLDEESVRVTKIKEYIQKHYTENISLQEMADLVGMNPTAFNNYFKLRTGKSLVSYIVDVRLTTASRSLIDTTHNVSEICYESGFTNLSNFNRLFKARYGLSPREYRSSYRKNKMII